MGNATGNKGTVVYVGGFVLPDRNAAAHRVVNNAKILSQIGYNVVFCGVDDKLDLNDEGSQRFGEYWTFPVKYPKSNLEWVGSLLSIKHIRKIVSRFPDTVCVIAYNMHAIPLRKLIKFCRLSNIKIIADVTEWMENRLSINPASAIRCYDTYRVMNYYHKKVDGMIAISSYLADFYSKDVKTVLQIPPLVDIEDPIWTQPCERESDKATFVYAGRPERGGKKDLLGILMECFVRLRDSFDFRLLIVGSTEEFFLSEYPEYRNDVEQLKDRISFKGKVSHDVSVRYLLSSDCSIFFRRNTRKNNAGFPTKFVEGVTSGIQIIANKISNIADYADRSKCFLTDSLDKNEIIEVLKKVITNGVDKERRLSSVFDYREYVGDMSAFIEKVLEK